MATAETTPVEGRGVCKAPDCQRSSDPKSRGAKGYCKSHYERLRKFGDLNMKARAPMVGRPCAVADCRREARSRSLCNVHYQRYLKRGDPIARTKSAKGEPLAYLFDILMNVDTDECVPWPFARSEGGYGRVYYDGRDQNASRVVCEIAHGPAPTALHEAAHDCGRGASGCVNKHHLSWKTRVDNQADRIAHGTSNRGVRHGSARLTEADVHEIRAKRGSCVAATVASQYGVSAGTIYDIWLRLTWAWLPEHEGRR